MYLNSNTLALQVLVLIAKPRKILGSFCSIQCTHQLLVVNNNLVFYSVDVASNQRVGRLSM